MSTPQSTCRRWMRRLLCLLLLIAFFIAGFSLAWNYVIVSGTERLAHLDKSRRELCQNVYGRNYLHVQGVDTKAEARLAAFDPAHGSNTLQLIYSNPFAGEAGLTLQGDGTLVSKTKNGTRKVAVIDHELCMALFHKVLTSGLLNYSEDVIRLKESLDYKLGGPGYAKKHVDDGSDVEIRITVPELEVDKEISIYEPGVALENHPDIIEFQLLIDLEKEIQNLAPEDDPDWRNKVKWRR